MIPLRDELRSRTTPGVTIAIVVLNAVAYFYELTLGPELRTFVFDWGFVPERLSAALHAGSEPVAGVAFTALSSMFLHGGWLHLLGNMWYLWIFGDNVEDRLGHVRYALFYLVAGVGAVGLHFLLNGDSALPTIGASGAIAGVLGAYAAVYPRARVITLVPFFPFFQVLALPAWLMLGMWFVYQFLGGFILAAWTTGGGGTAWWAHIGGFAFGYLVMRVARLERPRAETRDVA